MKSSSPHGWQLILADLALILFLVTLTALVEGFEETDDGSPDEGSQNEAKPSPYVAPAQALFRQIEGGPSLSQWLDEQPRDPRATLTIIAQHKGPSDKDRIWQKARELASSVEGSQVTVRVVITRADSADIYASLAFDTPNIEQQ